MNRRILATLLTIFFLFQSSSLANALDIPLLTWERGREQNIVVGGLSAKEPWDLKLLKPGAPQIIFKPSSVNRKGFLVYSATLPADLPVGNYTVYVFGDGSVSGTQVAEVKVITLTRYSITEIPKDLVFLLLTMIFIISALTVSRNRKYSRLTFLRQKNLIESETLLFDKRVPRFIYPAYVLRALSIGKLRTSLFKFLLMKDETFIHKISPFLYALLPAIGLALGLQGGLTTREQLPNIGLFSLMAISILGLLDAYSGIFAFFGFAVGQIIIGQALNVREAAVILSLGLSWVFTSFLAHLLYSVAEKDFPQINPDSGLGYAKVLLLIVVSVVTGVFFFGSLILTESLATSARNQHDNLVVTAIVVGTLSGVKVFIHHFLDWRITRAGHRERLVAESIDIIDLISQGGLIFAGFISLFTVFVWTENWTTALLVGILMVALFSSFTFHIRLPRIPFLTRWKRNVFFEAMVVTYLASTIFLYVQSLPYQVSLKSDIFTISGLALTLIHVVANTFYYAAEDKLELPL